MISLCVPTRNRPDVFKAMCLSVLNTASDPSDIEFAIYRDNDDESVYEYMGNYKEVRGKRIYPNAAMNECQKIATGPIYLFMPDDIIFQTKGWDEQVKEAFDKSTDKIIFVYFNDHHCGYKYGAIGCLHKNWVDTVGYIFHPELCRRGDVWVNEISKRINRKVYLEGVEYKDVYIIDDQTHNEYVMEIERTNPLAHYYSRRLKAARTRDAQLLQDFIDNYGTRNS
jgi:glycosyltransferase involved in cell wall biosynthesis